MNANKAGEQENKAIELAVTHSALIKEHNKVVDQLNALELENEKLKELLIKAGETTHECKELYDWYCENKTE